MTATVEKEKTVEKVREKKPESPSLPPVGGFVLWYAGADTGSGGSPALVLAAKGDALDLKVFRAGEDMTKTSVLHVGDRRLKENGFVRRQYGGWGEHPVWSKLYELTK